MRRHDRITLNPDAVIRSVACCTKGNADHYISQWIADGKAFVYPRQNPQPDTLQLGLAFIDNGVKHRAFLQARHQDIVRSDLPHELTECLDLFSEEAAVRLRQMAGDLKSAGFPLYVFGSVAWEKISGQIYRNEKSDLDILCDVRTLQDLRFVTNVFAAAECELPFRIDGELRFPNDDCANWLEIVSALEHQNKNQPNEMQVLIKGETGVYMSTLRSLLEASYA